MSGGSEQDSGLVGQGLSILEVLRKSTTAVSANGSPPAAQVPGTALAGSGRDD